MAGRRDAADCFSRLKKLKDYAEESLSRHHSSPTERKLLTSVIDNVKDCLWTLRAWLDESYQPNQPQRPELLDRATLDQITNGLFDSIEKAEAALDARLRQQRPQPGETLDACLRRWGKRFESIIHRNRYGLPSLKIRLVSYMLSDLVWKSSFGYLWTRWKKQ